jgi:EmrB/QacA subfamily drug resistance transporter
MIDLGRPWPTFWLAAATIFMVSLDATVIVAAFPVLRATFSESSAATLSWTINAYTIVFAAFLVPFGRMVDHLGRRRCFLLGTGGFTLASAACALAPSPEGLIASRIVQAISAAMISPASLALILAAFGSEQRSRSAGLWSAVGALAAASGPAIGSLLIEWFSWRMIFLINLPIGLTVLTQARQKLSADPPRSVIPRFDGIGTLLIVLGVGGIAAGLAQAGETPLWSVAVLPMVVAGLVLLVGFPFWAARQEEPAIDMTLFAQVEYRWASLGTLLLGVSFGLMFLALYLFFTGVWHYSQSLAGWAATPGPLLATIVAVAVSGRLAKWGSKNVLLAGGLLFAASNVWLALRVGPEPAYLATWLPGQISGGIAIGLMMPALVGAAVSHLRPGQLGIGTAVNSAIRLLGSSLGVALAVALAGGATSDAEPFRQIYISLTACSLLIAVISRKL